MRIRKRVAAAVLVAGFGAAGVLGTGIARGDLPMNIALSGQPFTATIGSLSGTSISIYPRNVTTSAGTTQTLAIKLGSATLTDLCLSMTTHDIPLVGDATLFIRAPGASAHAENLVIDAQSLGGTIGVRDLLIGADVSSSDERAGRFGTAIMAGSSNLTSARLTATSLRASSLTLTNFSVSMEKGPTRC